MNNIIFLCSLALAVFALFVFCFPRLPREGWQFIAAIPVKKLPDGKWFSKNLTWYGALTALAFTAALALFLVLAAAAGLAPLPTGVFIAAVLLVTVPSAKLLARIIEKRRGTQTIGGAAFLGLLAAPWVSLGLEASAPGYRGCSSPLLAALLTAYALGEGLGRLSCLSFGCCYGKRLADLPRPLQALFRPFAFKFFGATKKAAYAGGLEGEGLVPIQAVTAVFYAFVAFAAAGLFLDGAYPEAFLTASLGTLLWRPVSEFFRADFRGGGKLTVYQKMSLAGALYSVAVYFLWPLSSSQTLDILVGLKALADWRPLVLLEAAFLGIFLYTGVSSVTESMVLFRVHPETAGEKKP